MRNNESSFTKDEILKFHEIITLSESESKKSSSNLKMGGKCTKKIKAENQIQLIKKKVSEIKKHEDTNKFLYTKNRDSIAASFIAHIRNAYSHSLISIEGDYFLIEDYKPIYKNKKIVGKEMTAYGRIHRNLLFPLIDCIIKDSNNDK